MDTEVRGTAEEALGHIRTVLYQPLGLRSCLELVLADSASQGAVRKREYLQSGSLPDLFRVIGVEKDGEIKGISFTKIRDNNGEHGGEPAYSLLIPSESDFDHEDIALVPNLKRMPYVTEGVVHLMPVTYLERSLKAWQQYDLYVTALKDVRQINAVVDSARQERGLS